MAPYNTDGIAEKIIAGLDVNNREKLVEKGFARAVEFSWRSTAEQTLKYIEMCIRLTPKDN